LARNEMSITDFISKERLQAILKAIRSLRIGVLGDFCLDAYFYADMARAQVSRETPLYNHPVVRETYSLGGAANVAWNLADLGAGEVLAVTVLGDDWRGELLRRLLRNNDIGDEHILVDPGRFSPFYGKVVLEANGLQQEDARLDFVNTQPLVHGTEETLINVLMNLLPGLDALVVADYQAYGAITQKVLNALNDLAHSHPAVIMSVDSRERIGCFKGMVLKPNELEAVRAVFPGSQEAGLSEEDIQMAGKNLQSLSGRPVYLTRGELGCMVFDEGQEFSLPPATVTGSIDPVGAGDTFLSALSAGLAAGANSREAGVLATLATSVSIHKLHITGTASPSEILAVYEKAGK
jgi:rfaE bifunctional protein kinase chain/domain